MEAPGTVYVEHLVAAHAGRGPGGYVVCAVVAWRNPGVRSGNCGFSGSWTDPGSGRTTRGSRVCASVVRRCEGDLAHALVAYSSRAPGVVPARSARLSLVPEQVRLYVRFQGALQFTPLVDFPWFEVGSLRRL